MLWKNSPGSSTNVLRDDWVVIGVSCAHPVAADSECYAPTLGLWPAREERRVIENLDDFRALDPFFRTIEEGLAEYVDGEHFFDMLAQDVVFDFIITVPNYPRHIVGRADLIELYRGYGSTFFLDRCYDLRVHHSPSTSSVVLEYSSEGRVVATGQPYGNRYISVVVIKDRKVTEWRDYLDPLRVFAALEGRPFEPDGNAAAT